MTLHNRSIQSIKFLKENGSKTFTKTHNLGKGVLVPLSSTEHFYFSYVAENTVISKGRLLKIRFLIFGLDFPISLHRHLNLSATLLLEIKPRPYERLKKNLIPCKRLITIKKEKRLFLKMSKKFEKKNVTL